MTVLFQPLVFLLAGLVVCVLVLWRRKVGRARALVEMLETELPETWARIPAAERRRPGRAIDWLLREAPPADPRFAERLGGYLGARRRLNLALFACLFTVAMIGLWGTQPPG